MHIKYWILLLAVVVLHSCSSSNMEAGDCLSSTYVPGDLAGAIEHIATLELHKQRALSMDLKPFVARESTVIQSCLQKWESKGLDGLSKTLQFFRDETEVDMSSFIAEAAWHYLRPGLSTPREKPERLPCPKSMVCPQVNDVHLQILYLKTDYANRKNPEDGRVFYYYARCEADDTFWVAEVADDYWRKPNPTELAEMKRHLSDGGRYFEAHNCLSE